MKISINFKNVGSPTEKMISIMCWITSELRLEPDIHYDELVWQDFDKALEFIDTYIEETKEHSYLQRQLLKERSLIKKYKPFDDDYQGT